MSYENSSAQFPEVELSEEIALPSLGREIFFFFFFDDYIGFSGFYDSTLMITKWEIREHHLARPEAVVDLVSLPFRFLSSVSFSFPSFSSSAGVFTLPLLGRIKTDFQLFLVIGILIGERGWLCNMLNLY